MTPSAGLPQLDPCSFVPGCALFTGAGASVAGAAAKGIFSALATWVATGASSLVQHVLGQLSAVGTASHPAKAAAGPSPFETEEGFMLVLMEFVLLPMLLVATVGAIARADLARLGRTWLVALPVAVVGALAGVEVTHAAMKLVDTLSAAVLSQIDVQRLINSSIRRVVALEALPAGGGDVAVFFVAVIAILAGLLLWIELVIRNAAIYIALLFMPLALAGFVWPSSSRMAKRMVEMLVALVLSKFVIAAVLTLGANLLSASSGLDAGLTGAAILLLAGFAPFALLRMVPIVEAGAIGHLEGLSRRPLRAATLPLQVASMTTPLRAALNKPLASPKTNTIGSTPILQHPGSFLPGASGEGGSNEAGKESRDPGPLPKPTPRGDKRQGSPV